MRWSNNKGTPLSIRIELSHDKQEIELWHDDGVEKLSMIGASTLAQQLNVNILKLEERRTPPAPAPLMWDGKEMAECNACEGQQRVGEMLCAGGLMGHEMYLSDFYRLKEWLDRVFEYHRKNKCQNLANLEEVRGV